ncbi:hypothetical protein BDV12DRAFT_101459 [Aspergillus spectabilis]
MSGLAFILFLLVFRFVRRLHIAPPGVLGGDKGWRWVGFDFSRPRDDLMMTFTTIFARMYMSMQRPYELVLHSIIIVLHFISSHPMRLFLGRCAYLTVQKNRDNGVDICQSVYISRSISRRTDHRCNPY